MNAQAMADLFDEVQIDAAPGSGDYGTDSKDKPAASFESRVEDIQAVMDTELPFEEDEVIGNAVKAAKKEKTLPSELRAVLEKEGGADYEAEVAEDSKQFDNILDDAEELKIEPKKSEEEKPELEEEIPNTPTGADDNPFNLVGIDLEQYNDVKARLPQFVLYDGSLSFKDFYQHKFNILRQVVGRFPILNLKLLGEEIGNINVDHYVGDRAISAELIQRRLDESYQQRARLSSIMIKILEQQSSWERWCELLKAKLWKDHELKGTHRRDGLTLEHMADMEDYVHYMKGVMESAKHVDVMLKAAAESLSRQLSCLQIREATGFVSVPTVKAATAPAKSDKSLDHLESIGSGIDIKAPVASTKATETIFGLDEDDELANL